MDERFDIVIVGAGSAGCALARRLSDDPSVTVALVEAGGEPSHPFIAAPTEYFKLWGTEIDWDYESVPQRGTADRRHRLPRGRVLGGTSAINGMVYLRGAARTSTGGSERAVPAGAGTTFDAATSNSKNWCGPEGSRRANELSEVFIDAAMEAGLRFNPFFDDGDLDGCGWNRLSIHRGERHSSYRAFVEPVLDRPNLHVITDAVVDRVVIARRRRRDRVEVGEPSGKRPADSAQGRWSCAPVPTSRHDFDGVGNRPAQHLRDHDIEVVVDLHVGDNLQDHLLVGVVQTATRPIDPLHAHITESCAFARSSADAPSCDIEISFNREMLFAPPVDDGVPRFTIIPGVTRLRESGDGPPRPSGLQGPIGDRSRLLHGSPRTWPR